MIFYNLIKGGMPAMTRKKLPNGLTQQQEDFCRLYVKYGIGYRAMIEAYPKAKTWLRSSVDSQVQKLLNNPLIDHRINELNAQIESTLKTTLNLNKRKILEEIIELQQKAKQQDSQNTINLQALKLLSQIAGMLSEQPAVNVNVNNNNIMADISNYLDI